MKPPASYSFLSSYLQAASCLPLIPKLTSLGRLLPPTHALREGVAVTCLCLSGARRPPITSIATALLIIKHYEPAPNSNIPPLLSRTCLLSCFSVWCPSHYSEHPVYLSLVLLHYLLAIDFGLMVSLYTSACLIIELIGFSLLVTLNTSYPQLIDVSARLQEDSSSFHNHILRYLRIIYTSWYCWNFPQYFSLYEAHGR